MILVLPYTVVGSWGALPKIEPPAGGPKYLAGGGAPRMELVGGWRVGEGEGEGEGLVN